MGENEMESLHWQEESFFSRNQRVIPIYQAFKQQVSSQYPEVSFYVQKTQITFTNRHVFACVSFLRVKRKSELPDPYLIITLGMPAMIHTDRPVVITGPYPGRWTTHVVIGSLDDLDEEFYSWVDQAYHFAMDK